MLELWQHHSKVNKIHALSFYNKWPLNNLKYNESLALCRVNKKPELQIKL